MDSANQIESLVQEVEKNPEYKISEQEAKGFLSEIKSLLKKIRTICLHYCNNGLY